MKSLSLIVLFVLVHFVSNAQYISNIQASQAGNQVLISYEMVGLSGPQHIDILCSSDGGNTFTIPVKSATGDIGNNIAPGGRKTVVWNVLSDVQALHSNQAVFKITASAAGSGSVAASAGYVLDFDGIEMNIYDIKRSGNVVKFLFRLKSLNKDAEAFIHHTHFRMIDNEGNVYENNTAVTLGPEENRGAVRQQLIQGVPMKGELIFKDVPATSKNIAVLEIKVNNETRQQRQITIP